MVTRRVSRKETSDDSRPSTRPATTPEAREKQLSALAENLAEKQLRDGSASQQVVLHYLKLASTRERLEQDRIRNEIKLTDAKIESMASQKRIEELYQEALSSMRSYSTGQPLSMEPEFDD